MQQGTLSLTLLFTIFVVMRAPHPTERSTGSLLLVEDTNEDLQPHVTMIQTILNLWWYFFETFHIDSQQSDENSDEEDDFFKLSSNNVNINDTNEDDVDGYLLISSSRPPADHWVDLLGLYRREMKDGRSVYIQEHDTEKYRYRGFDGYAPPKLFSN